MPQHKIALITDSACDIPDELVKQHAIDVVPLYVIWGQQELRDRIDIQPKAFYERIVTDPVHPKTSQPAPQDFVVALRQAEQSGADEALVVTISGGMSSTYASAHQAAEMVDIPVKIVDSKANSMSLGWQVLAAARAREAGGDIDAMMRAMDKVRKHLVTLLYVDTLEYLHRGGRIGAAAKWIGQTLDLRPHLYVDHTTGKIEPGERIHTRARAIEKLYQNFFSQMDTGKPLRVAIVHGNVTDDAKALAERITKDYAPIELVIGMTSPVMGVHTGPGALALCGYWEE